VPGLLFLGPGPLSLETGRSQYGPLIVDGDGEPIWFRAAPPGLEVTNFAASHYRGQPVLTWWEGKILPTGYGIGEGVVADRSYREIARVRAARGRSMDLHEFRLTPRGTALFTCYPEFVLADLSPVGGSRNRRAVESIVQEVDVASGRLLFEWRSLAHVPLTDSYEPGQLDHDYDYLHVNSIEPTRDGHLLVSGRHTWALYKLSRDTGEVIWKLGGKRSDFQIGRGAQFNWQHDARQLSDGLLTVFDNGSTGPIQTERESRALLLDVDEARRTVRLRGAYTDPKQLVATSMGSVQVLPSGRVLVGWGTAAYTTEFAADGSRIADIHLPSGLYSFRSQWLEWRSAPHHPPAIAADRDDNTGAKLVYASWNGSTEVDGWRVDGGHKIDDLRPLGIAQRRGFETIIPLDPRLRYVSVTAVDADGRQLRRSDTIRV
jgi:hypothetical protein